MNRLIFSLLLLISTTSFSHNLDGDASWYGGKFIGRQTANGEIFDTELLTAAHKTLPFNTVVEVKNLENGAKVQVRINDRGPFIEGRIIDLSKKAAESIDLIKSGTAPVKLTIIDMPIAKQFMDIQVAAFSNFLYASSMKSKLEDAGFEPTTSMNNNGIMRIILPDVPINKTYEIVKKLETLGINNILIKHRG